MKFLSTLVIVIVVQLINGPQHSESILRPLIKLRPKIVLGKGKYDDDALGLYRVLGRTFVGLYLLGAIHKPYGGLYGGYQSPFSVTFSVGKKVEAGKSGGKHRHHRHHDDDEDAEEDDDHHHHHHHHRYKGESKSKYSDYTDEKSVKHIVVSHKFVDKPTSLDPSMMTEMVEGSTGPIVSAVTDPWSAASSAESASYRSPSSGMTSLRDLSSLPLSASSASSSSSSYSSSSSPVASIVRERKVYSSGNKFYRSKESEEVDSREDDVESSTEGDDYDDSEDQKNLPINVRSQSKIYNHRDETIDEPKGFKYGYSRPQYTDFMKSSESSRRQTIHEQEVVEDEKLNLNSNTDNSTEHRSTVFDQPEDSSIKDEPVTTISTPLPNVTTISTLPLNTTATSPLNVSESIKVSNATIKESVTPTEPSQPEDTTIVGDTFLEEIRKIENSLMVQKTEALGRLRIEKELNSASTTPSKVAKDEANYDLIISTPIHEEGESVEKAIVHRRRKNRRKNRKGRRKNRNSTNNNLNSKSRQRRRKINNNKKNRSNRRVPGRKNLKIADSYPIILPPGSRPYLTAINNDNNNIKKIKNRSHQFIINKSPTLPIESLYYPSPLSAIR